MAKDDFHDVAIDERSRWEICTFLSIEATRRAVNRTEKGGYWNVS